MGAPKKNTNEVKDSMVSVRMNSEDLKRFTIACSRDLIKPSAFAQKAIMDAVDRLIERQKKVGYQCMVDL